MSKSLGSSLGGLALSNSPRSSPLTSTMAHPHGGRAFSTAPPAGAGAAASAPSGRHQSPLAMHPRMFVGIPVTPMDISETPLIAWRLTLSEDTQVMCTLSASLVSTEGFSWTALLGGAKWSHFPEQFRQIIEQANAASQEEFVDSGNRRSQLYFAAFHAFQAGVGALPVGNYSVSKRLLDVSGRPCAAETYSWKVSSWFGRRTYVADVGGVAASGHGAAPDPVHPPSLGNPGSLSMINLSLTSEPPMSADLAADPARWTVDDVCHWLDEERLGQHAEAFRDADIDGEMLFELDDEMLRADLGITSKLEIRKVLTKRSRLEKDTASTSILDATFAPRTQTLHRMVSEADLRKLEENRELERLSLDLRSGHFGVEQARELVDMLELNTSVSSIAFTALGNDEAGLLADALRSTPQVTEVQLVHNCELTDPVVVQAIYDRTWLHSYAHVLRSVAANASTITALDWSDCGLGNDVALRLGRALRPNTVLKRLAATGNFFGGSGLDTLYEVLSGKQQLVELQLLSKIPSYTAPPTPAPAPTAPTVAAVPPGADGAAEPGAVQASSVHDSAVPVRSAALGRIVGHRRAALLTLCRDADTDATGVVGWATFLAAMGDLAIETDDTDARAGIMTELGVVDGDDTAVVRYEEALSLPAAAAAPAAPEPAPAPAAADSAVPPGPAGDPTAVGVIKYGSDRYTDPEHGSFTLKPVLDPEICAKIVALEQVVRDTTFQRAHVKAFQLLAMNNPECDGLRWGGQHLGDTIGLRLVKTLKSNSFVTAVELSQNNFSAGVVRELLEVLQSLEALRSLVLLPMPQVTDPALIADLADLEQQVKDRAWCSDNATLLSRLAENGRCDALDCEGLLLGDGMALELAQALHSNSTLRSLTLSGNRFGEAGVRALLAVLKPNRSLVDLKWVPQATALPAELTAAMVALQRSFRQTQVLKLLVTNDPSLAKLDRVHFDELTFGWLAGGPLAFNTSVEELDLSGCEGDFVKDGSAARSLIRLLASNRTIKTVRTGSLRLSQSTSDVIWSRENCEPFALLLRHVISNDAGLTELVTLPGMGDRGAAALARALRYNTVVKSVVLTRNSLTHNGSRELLGVLGNTGRVVTLHDSSMHDAAAPMLAREVRALSDRRWCDRHSTLLKQLANSDLDVTELIVAGEAVGDVAAYRVAEAIRSNTTLARFLFSETTIGDTGAKVLLDALRQNSTLEELKLLPNPLIRDRSLIARIGAMEHRVAGRKTLQLIAANDPGVSSLVWSSKGVDDDLACAIADALRGSIHVKEVDLSGNTFGNAGAEALLESIGANKNVAVLKLLPADRVRSRPGVAAPAASSARPISPAGKEPASPPTLLERMARLQQEVRDRNWLSVNRELLEDVTANGDEATDLRDACSGEGMGDTAALRLVEALRCQGLADTSGNLKRTVNSKVTVLDMSYNCITNKGGHAILEVAKLLPGLRELVMLPNPLLTDAELLSAIKTEQQRIRDDAWCEAQQAVLVSLAQNSPAVTKLEWSGNQLGDGVVVRLEAALEGNTSVVSIDLSRNCVTDAGAKRLLTRLQQNTAISEVKLLPNQFIHDADVKSELKVMNSLFVESTWQRPRKTAETRNRPTGDGNAGHYVWNPRDRDARPRDWLDSWVPFDVSLDGEAAWEVLPVDAIRFDQKLPTQASRPPQQLSALAMRRRREQLAIRLSRCLPHHLHDFVKVLEANQVGWKRVLEVSQELEDESS